MPLRSVAIARVPPRASATSVRQHAAAEVLAHFVVALALGSVLLLALSASLAGVPPQAGPMQAFEAWSLIRSSTTLQIGAAVLATALASLAKAGGCSTRADRWCVVAALCAAAGTLLLVAPPV